MTDGERTVDLAPQTMDLLLALIERRGEVVTQEDLRAQVWAGTFIAGSGMFRAVSELRRALGDDSRAPRYIQTIPKRGYRLVANVSVVAERTPSAEHTRGPTRTHGSRYRFFTSLAATLLLVVVGGLWWLLVQPRPRAGPMRQSDPPESFAVGRIWEDRVDCAAYEQARMKFEEALSSRPDYRLTYENLTDSYLAAMVLGCIPVDAAKPRIQELVGVDSKWESERQRLRREAAMRLWLDWDFSAAGAIFRLVPELPDVSRAAYLVNIGRLDEAVGEAERAAHESPAQLGEAWTLATTLLFARQHAAARARYTALLSMYPDYPPALSLSALAGLLEGRWAEAAASAHRADLIIRSPMDRFSAIPALVLVKLGKAAEAREFLDRWDAAAHRAPYVTPTAHATAALAKGDRAGAIRHLQNGARTGDPWMLMIPHDPTFTDLRDEAAFKALVRLVEPPGQAGGQWPERTGRLSY